jgi:PAT family beta-lactamase induction signal transducer AmpG
VAPLADFLKRPLWAEIVLFVVLYKFGDALAGVMANPLYAALHFTEGEVADISKAFGIGATLVGFAAGGLLMARLSLYPSLLICGVLQNVTTLMYAVLASAGHDLWVFGLSVALENVTGGMGSAVFVAYLSRLCNVSFTATQYALLSSLAAVGRTTLSSSGGWLVTAVGWVPFFVIATAAGLPALAVLFRLIRRAPIPAVAAA